MTRLDAWMAELGTATAAAEAAEKAHREEAARRTAELERERTFAHRRANLVRAVAGAVAGAPDRGTAVAHGLAMFRARLGWTAGREAHDEIVERFAPVCLALRAACGADAAAAEEGEPEDGGEAAEEAPAPDPAEALADFERWYEEARGSPFWLLFQVYMPETPLVDW